MEFKEFKKFLEDNHYEKPITERIQKAFDSIKSRPNKVAEEYSLEKHLHGYGGYDIDIKNKSRYYRFENLKANASFSNDICGLGLNHYGWRSLPMPSYKRSRFHDSEDVDIVIEKDDFVSAERVAGKNIIYLEMKTWTATITWS